MNKYFIPLEEGIFYHIYNQGNNRENIFYKDENYIYFMKKFDMYLTDFVELYAFCLMPNHFHFLVRVKSLEEIDKNVVEKFNDYYKQRSDRYSIFSKNGISKTSADIYSDFISEQFRRLFLSYSKSINKQSDRKGSLFCKNFRRKKVSDLQYLQNVVIYIHRNPAHHGFAGDFRDYRWSSYDRMMEEKVTKLKKREVLEWFGDKENYRYVHCQNVEDDIE
ncbi:MAG: transposase [Prevotellaceae bacterium]|jgi:REP element-mobilizing transposase RayT|nr:transposase [Prevotellaceae bacterium]